MIWIQENKGLAVFLGICLIASLALGFVGYGDYGTSSDAFTKFDSTRKKVETSEKSSLYPDQESVDLKKKSVDSLEVTTSALRADLVKFQEPLNMTMDGNQFQTQLASRLDGLRKLGERKKVTLPETFRLDFDAWVDTTAPKGAVPKLDFQLEAISNLVTTAIESGISEVISVERTKLKEESGRPSENDEAGANNNNQGQPEVLVNRYPVEFVFRTPHEGLVNFLNALSNTSLTPSHFFVIRLVEIQNDTLEGPSKESAFTPVPIYPENGGIPGVVDPLAPVIPGTLDPAIAPVDPGIIPPDPIPLDPAAPIDPTIPVDPGFGPPPPVFGVGEPTAYYDTQTLLGSEQVKVFVKVEVIRFKEEEKKAEEEGGETPGS